MGIIIFEQYIYCILIIYSQIFNKLIKIFTNYMYNICLQIISEWKSHYFGDDIFYIGYNTTWPLFSCTVPPSRILFDFDEACLIGLFRISVKTFWYPNYNNKPKIVAFSVFNLGKCMSNILQEFVKMIWRQIR